MSIEYILYVCSIIAGINALMVFVFHREFLEIYNLQLRRRQYTIRLSNKAIVVIGALMSALTFPFSIYTRIKNLILYSNPFYLPFTDQTSFIISESDIDKYTKYQYFDLDEVEYSDVKIKFNTTLKIRWNLKSNYPDIAIIQINDGISFYYNYHTTLSAELEKIEDKIKLNLAYNFVEAFTTKAPKEEISIFYWALIGTFSEKIEKIENKLESQTNL